MKRTILLSLGAAVLFLTGSLHLVAAQAAPTVTLGLSSACVATGQTITAFVTVKDSAGTPIKDWEAIGHVKDAGGVIRATSSGTKITDLEGTALMFFDSNAFKSLLAGNYTVTGETSDGQGGTRYTSAPSTLTIGSCSAPSSGSSGGASAGTTASGPEVGLPNPIKCPDATCLVSQVIRYILGTIAVIATLMFIWGGVMMMTSGGNAEQVKRAKETLVWATIGIVVILISWAVIRFVLNGIAGTSQ